MFTIKRISTLAAITICSCLSSMAYSQAFVALPNYSLGGSGGLGAVQPLQPSALPSNQPTNSTARSTPVQPTAEQINALPPETRAAYLQALSQKQEAIAQRNGDMAKQTSELQSAAGASQQVLASEAQKPQVALEKVTTNEQATALAQKNQMLQATPASNFSETAKAGAGAPVGGIGSQLSNSNQNQAAAIDQAKVQVETQSNVREIAVQNANDQMQQMKDVITDIRNKLSPIQQAPVETNRGISRNI